MGKLDVKGILFDFGGTLDTNGNHWGEVLWDTYLYFGLSILKEDFRSAYIYAERTLATQPLIKSHFLFIDVLQIKLDIQLSYLMENNRLFINKIEKEKLVYQMAEYIDKQTKEILFKSFCILQDLKKNYKLALVSNFYGNINTILEDCKLLSLFEKIIESAVVKVRKPNPAIFALGVCALNLSASEIVVIGDSFVKDIEPAHTLGCRTIWLKGKQWEDEKQGNETLPDVIIQDLSEIRYFL